MSTARPTTDIDFLLWLERYVGRWTCDGQEYRVTRREDGLLEARSCNVQKVSLSVAIEGGKRVGPPDSHLGMFPVVLDMDLMKVWLTRKQIERLNGAWCVGAGMRLILRSVERRMKSCDARTFRSKCKEMWKVRSWRSEKMSSGDQKFHAALLKMYRRQSE